MKPRSAKNKGSRYEKAILELCREHLDAHAYQPAGSGNGTEKGDVYLPNHSIVLEVKNQKTIKLVDWWDQAEAQALGDQVPVLVIRNPKYAEGRKNLAVLDFEALMVYLQAQHDHVEVDIKDADYETRSALDRIEQGCKALKRKYRL